MKQDEVFALYDAIVTAEASGDYATASAYNEKLNNTILVV